jgi:hypothetical protein
MATPESESVELTDALDRAIIAELDANCQIIIENWNCIRRFALDFGTASFNRGSDDSRIRLIQNMWGAAYGMIAASRRLSRFLWEGKYSKRHRQRFHVQNDSPIREANRVRDALEHIEQRIPEFVRYHTNMKLAGWTVSNDPSEPTRPDSVRLRHLNTTTWVCGAYDRVNYRECNLEAIAAAAHRLKIMLPQTLWTDLEHP